jgi:D-beta-D-heptose 7-phosphate kinase/D-beta-D-heptose 1-phosphate adenosyltransferase
MNFGKKGNYKKFNILVIGDSCIDKYIYGDVFRLAPEGPIPILNPINEVTTPGMAGNVQRNLDSLGVNSYIITNKTHPVKTRYVDDRSGQLLIRVDENDKIDRIDKSTLNQIISNKYQSKKIDAIIISDYNKGFLTDEDVEFICDNNDNVFIDTKKQIGDWLKNCSFIKINHVEYDLTKSTIDKLQLNSKLIVTLSSRGCRYIDKIFPVDIVPVKDVSGAGDTFLAGLVTEYVRTKDIEKSITFAQKCATIVVQKKGVSVV